MDKSNYICKFIYFDRFKSNLPLIFEISSFVFKDWFSSFLSDSSHFSIRDEKSAIDFLLGGLGYSTGVYCFFSIAFNQASNLSISWLNWLEDCCLELSELTYFWTSPIINSKFHINNYGVTLSDFPKHDYLVEYVFYCKHPLAL